MSTGGTARALEAAGLTVRAIDDLTGFPEMMDGRLKTLHPRVHGGLLARRELESHRHAAEEHGIDPIDLVCVNLYPFTQTLASGAPPAEVIEQIDIGGPAMVRSAAKNHLWTAIVTSPGQYAGIQDELDQNDGQLSLQTRSTLAAEAFRTTATYDAAIATWMLEHTRSDQTDSVAPPYNLASPPDTRFGTAKILTKPRGPTPPTQAMASFRPNNSPGKTELQQLGRCCRRAGFGG